MEWDFSARSRERKTTKWKGTDEDMGSSVGKRQEACCYRGCRNSGPLLREWASQAKENLEVAVCSPKAGGLQTQFSPLSDKGRSALQQGGQGSNGNPERKDNFLLELLSLWRFCCRITLRSRGQSACKMHRSVEPNLDNQNLLGFTRVFDKYPRWVLCTIQFNNHQLRW